MVSGRAAQPCLEPLDFLSRHFDKLLVNFTWWINREDAGGNNLFESGFLGLDNIGPIDRSHLPVGGTLEQSDATGWMASYAIAMGHRGGAAPQRAAAVQRHRPEVPGAFRRVGGFHLAGVTLGHGSASCRRALPTIGWRVPGMVPDRRRLPRLPGVAAMAAGVRVPGVRP
jgi:hypothetical protein